MKVTLAFDSAPSRDQAFSHSAEIFFSFVLKGAATLHETPRQEGLPECS